MRKFESLSGNNAAMLGVYVSIVKNLQDKLNKVLKAIHQLTIDDMLRDIPMISLTLELLQIIPSIGFLIVATIIAQIGDFSAFPKPKKLVIYFRIDLSVIQSRESIGTHNKMTKRGLRLLRRVLYTTVLTIICTRWNNESYNPVLMDFYKKKSQSEPKEVALGSVMQNLVYIIFAVHGDRKLFELRTPSSSLRCLL